MGYGTEMDGCGRFMKYSLFVANFVMFIGGIVVTGLAIWALVDKVPWIGELVGNDMLTGVVYVLLVCGIIVTFISFFGCLGASREIKCMLLTYFTVVLFLFVIMLIGGIFGYVFREKLSRTLQNEMQTSMRFYDSKKVIREAWDVTQRTLRCCGVYDWRDWQRYGYKIPQSCCKESAPGQYFRCNLDYNSLSASTAYINGCLRPAQQYLESHAAVMGAAGVVVACLMLFGMIFSCALFRLIE